MYCCGQERRWGRWALLIPLIPIGIAGIAALFGWVVMLLWNALLPAVLGVGTITFWQALGILVLSKILFGGFSGHGHGRSRHHDHHRHYRMREKWMHLSPEEREKMKAEYDHHCGCDDKKE